MSATATILPFPCALAEARAICRCDRALSYADLESACDTMMRLGDWHDRNIAQRLIDQMDREARRHVKFDEPEGGPMTWQSVAALYALAAMVGVAAAVGMVANVHAVAANIWGAM